MSGPSTVTCEFRESGGGSYDGLELRREVWTNKNRYESVLST